MNNPLRYPGAKSKLFEYVKNLINTEILSDYLFLEPYAGSAALTFLLLENNIIKKAKINEKDPLIYNFWLSVFNHTNELIEKINETEITLENWMLYSNFKVDDFLAQQTALDIGFAGLFLNRTSFSGILKGGPLGGFKQKSEHKIDCRFNKEQIIRNILHYSTFADKIEIYNTDAIEFLKQETRYKRNLKVFAYIDPPYYEKGKSLYRCYYEKEQHKDLSNFIKNKTFPWLVSYDTSKYIEKLYSKNNRINLFLDYSAKTSKKGKELLISNLKIPPVENKVVQEQLIT